MRNAHGSRNHPSRHTVGQQAGLAAAGWRTLHLVDADNLLGDPQCTDAAHISSVFAAYRQASAFAPGDHVVVATGCNSQHVLSVELAWPAVCHRRRSGPDGADMALLEESDWAARVGRFRRVVIGSGDRIFLAALDRLRSADITVDVVSRRRSLSSALAVRARGSLHYLPEIA